MDLYYHKSRKHIAWTLLTRDLCLYAIKVGKAYFDCKMYDLAKEFYEWAQKVMTFIHIRI